MLSLLQRPSVRAVRVIFIAAAAASAFLLAGCATTSKWQAPKLTVIGANLTSADVFSQVFRVRLHVINPNDRPLPVKVIDYTLDLEGDAFAEGQSPIPFTVPANGEADFDLPVHTHFVSSIARLLSRLNGTGRTQIAYTFSGSVTLDMSFSPKLKFSESGAVDLRTR